MLKGIHFLLTYTCSFECDHCFLYCSPSSEGTFTFDQIKKVLKEAKKIKTIDSIYYEGGEPFLFYPIMLEGIQEAKNAGFDTGVVTNAYWGLSVQDAKIWLKPLSDLDITNLSVSDDSFHYGDKENTPAKYAVKAAQKLNIPLVRGGPANLARLYNVDHEDAYVDECHLCYKTRLKLIDQFPEYLAPRQVYGLSKD